MKPSLLPLILVILFSPLCWAQQGWDWLPILNPDYEADPVFSVGTGVMTPAPGDSGPSMYWSFELGLASALLKVPGGQLRQQLSYTTYEEDDVKIQTFEANPHYLIALSERTALGVGPGLGYVKVSGPRLDDSDLPAFQLGTSLHYYHRTLFLGTELIYQLTEQKRLSPDVRGMNNLRIGFELGFVF